MTTLQPVRGTHDLLPLEHRKHSYIIDAARKVAASYGFLEMATPLLEFKEVFKRTLGDVSDIVTKEMYEIVKRGDEEIVLRPEGTAGIARAVMSNGLTQSMPLKFFYEGPMFRYERPQKGRLRQLHQIGAELFGVSDSMGDVEVIALAFDILKVLGLSQHVTLEINTLGDDESRKLYRDHLVAYLKDHHASLSPDSQQRLDRNPLRILDTKDEGDKKILNGAPLLTESLNAFSQEMFLKIQEGLNALKIPFQLNPHLVRGLDYYCHIAFEFTTTELGSQGTVLAGGRYDGLMTTMGGPSIPGVGWAGGIDRLALMLSEDALPPFIRPIAIIPMDEAFDIKGLELAQALRGQGHVVEMTYGGNLGKRLKKANKMNAHYAFILGEAEVASHTVTLKDLDTGEQTQLPREQIGEWLKDKGIS
ncbi:MAG: histidine--tRNA ligase [Alphaproteobacteria bacterium 41-28]|nr:MAG: histidine--tRNA ligase [Alphaproteobacteria bacterium 41-28]